MISDTAGLARAKSRQRRKWPHLSAERLLSLAAAPTFAIMAFLAAVQNDNKDMMCSVTNDASPLTGMVAMYVLMSAFHAAPWLRVIRRRRFQSPL
ncbi:MAG TPA: hypothetical protein VN838_08510 [Bradyrhizobium sp.]|nr:hypothetical protein [Bradyrhizobium sp.]